MTQLNDDEIPVNKDETEAHPFVRADAAVAKAWTEFEKAKLVMQDVLLKDTHDTTHLERFRETLRHLINELEQLDATVPTDASKVK